MRYSSLRVGIILFCSIALGSAGFAAPVRSLPDAGSSDTNRQDVPVHGIDPANLDRSVSPGQDFFKFATGGWVANHPIPLAYGSWGNFNILQDQNQEKLQEILQAAERNTRAAKGSNEQKIGDFYFSGMNEKEIEAAGTKPLAPWLNRIDKITTRQHLEREIAQLSGEGAGVLFYFGPNQDFKDASRMIGSLHQGGLGMPDRDYYLKDDARSKEIRDAYVKHVAKVLEMLGDEPAKAAAGAATVLAIETRLAQASMSRVDMRDPNSVYHKMDLAALKQLTPGFDWTSYFKELGLTSPGEINVAQPEFFKALDGMLTTVPIQDWKIYLRWHLINGAAPFLSSDFVNEDFEFRGKVLTGTKEILPRWKRVVATTDRELGEALGQIYVERYFPPEARARALEMVNNLMSTLKDDLSTLSWMSDATRKQAIAKLDAITKKIGYPNKWKDYSGLKIDRGPYVLNVLRAREFEFKRDIERIGKPVDRERFGMTPPTVNAYYNASMNEIVFPAGILQPPFYDPKADDAVNYGGIGAVIGHEMTHGFDDSGSKFDAKGNLANWWSPEDLKNFKERAQCVINQFDGFVVQGDLHENGRLVAGESIADLGGLKIAYKAFQKSLEGKPHPKDIDGFTAEQRFFLAYAQIWASSARPEFEQLQAKTNPHPLPRFRVNGPLSNMPEFAKAFNCKEGDPMVRPASERCQIW